MPYFTLIYSRFPAGCKGFLNGIAMKTPNGNYIVWIDTDKDEATQAFTLRHELAHLFFKHLEQGEANTEEEYQEREREADKYAERITPEELNYLLSFCTGTKTINDADITAFDLDYAQGKAG